MSDIFLAVLLLLGLACTLWILDIQPYSNKLQIYNQTCTEMILENTYSKGKWINDPVVTYNIDKETNTVELSSVKTNEIFESCKISNRKNWSCPLELDNNHIEANNGVIIRSDIDKRNKQQISRFKLLQIKLLEILGYSN